MIITGINTRICAMRLFNTGLNKFAFQSFVNSDVPIYNLCICSRAIGVVSRTVICGKGRGLRGVG